MSEVNVFPSERNPNGRKSVGQERKLRKLVVFKREMGGIRKLLFPERILRIKENKKLRNYRNKNLWETITRKWSRQCSSVMVFAGEQKHTPQYALQLI